MEERGCSFITKQGDRLLDKQVHFQKSIEVHKVQCATRTTTIATSFYHTHDFCQQVIEKKQGE